jgi:hypothetical protein
MIRNKRINQWALDFMAEGEARMAEAYAFSAPGRSFIWDSLGYSRNISTPILDKLFTAVYVSDFVAADIHRAKQRLKWN